MHLCKSVARDWRLFARVNTISPGSVSSLSCCCHLPGNLRGSCELETELTDNDCFRNFDGSACGAHSFFDTPMGAAPEVQETVYRYSVLGRQGVPAELKGAFLVSFRRVGTHTQSPALLSIGEIRTGKILSTDAHWTGNLFSCSLQLLADTSPGESSARDDPVLPRC